MLFKYVYFFYSILDENGFSFKREEEKNLLQNQIFHPITQLFQVKILSIENMWSLWVEIISSKASQTECRLLNGSRV